MQVQKEAGETLGHPCVAGRSKRDGNVDSRFSLFCEVATNAEYQILSTLLGEMQG